jgi:steroid 5-alpha reductase family enzyme
MHARLVLVLALVSAWAARLTWNWVRRWRGLGDEDWRYAEYRTHGPVRYWLTSLAGFHLLPTLLVFAGCLPLLAAVDPGTGPLNLLDALAALITSGGILLEWQADRELHRFLKNRTDSSKLLTRGLWARFRHPNYIGELAFWWGLAVFGMAASPAWWVPLGALAITLLFVFISVPMMDRRLKRRHPAHETGR